jgi:hypothetical protein
LRDFYDSFSTTEHAIQTVGVHLVEAEELFGTVPPMVSGTDAMRLLLPGPGPATDGLEFQCPQQLPNAVSKSLINFARCGSPRLTRAKLSCVSEVSNEKLADQRSTFEIRTRNARGGTAQEAFADH